MYYIGSRLGIKYSSEAQLKLLSSEILEVLFYAGMTILLVERYPFYKENSVEFSVDFS